MPGMTLEKYINFLLLLSIPFLLIFQNKLGTIMLMLNHLQIRNLRLALGETLKEFAARMGVTPDAIVKWEGGRSHPTFSKMVKLNELLKELPKDLQEKHGLVLVNIYLTHQGSFR